MLIVPMFLRFLFHHFCFGRGNEAQGMTTENKGSMVRARKKIGALADFELKFPKQKTKSYHKVTVGPMK